MTITEGRLAHPPASRWLSETGPEACHVKDKARDRLPPHLLLPSSLRATNHSPLHGASSLVERFRSIPSSPGRNRSARIISDWAIKSRRFACLRIDQ